MGAPPPFKFPSLSISHGNRLGCLGEAVPNLFEEPQPVGNAQRLDLLADGAHGRILRLSFCDSKPHVRTHNADAERRAKRVRSSVLLASGLAGLQPSPERRLCFARRAASEETGDADVFVKIRPVHAFAATDQAPIRAFRRCCMREPWVPQQRYADGAPVDEIDDEGVLSDGYLLRQRRARLTR